MSEQKNDGEIAEARKAPTTQRETESAAEPRRAALYVYAGPYREWRTTIEGEGPIALKRGVPVQLSESALKALGAKVRRANAREIAAAEKKS
ncbi:MAG: hypothetical protein ACXW5J_26685 [Thermoanaerobaculia bacterium]